MTETTDRFRADVAAALAGASPGDDHPSPEDLVAYRQGRLEPAEAENLQDHLVLCPECADHLAELESFVEAGSQGPPQARSLPETSAWRALQSRLRAPGRPALQALAASLLVAALGLGFWAFHQHGAAVELREQLARLSQPQPAATLVDLYPASGVRGVDGGPSPVDLGAADHLTVILHVPESPDAPAYEVDIVGSRGRTLWSGRVSMDAHGTLTLGIPRSFLDAGEYRIVLYGVTGDAREPLETFLLVLASDADSL